MIKRSAGMAVVALVVVLGGCERSPDETRINNEIIAGQSPIDRGTVDTGVLKDPAAYQPADYEPLNLDGDPAPVAGADADVPPVVAEVRDSLRMALEAGMQNDFRGVLEILPPESIAAYVGNDEYMDQLFELSQSYATASMIFADMATGTEMEPLAKLPAMMAELVDPLVRSAQVTPISEDSAVLRFDLVSFVDAIPAETRSAIEGVIATAQGLAGPMAGGAMPGGGMPGAAPGGLVNPRAQGPGGMSGATAESAAGMPSDMELEEMLSRENLEMASAMVSIPLRKVDGRWRVEFPLTLDEEQAEWLNEGAGIFSRMYTTQAEALAGLEDPSGPELMTVSQQASMSEFPALMGWIGRAQMLFQEQLQQLMPGGMMPDMDLDMDPGQMPPPGGGRTP